MERKWRKQIASQSGQSLIEMAVLVPLLLIVLLGAVDLGRVFFAYVTVANAAREGARYGSLHPAATSAEITARVTGESGGTLNLGTGNDLISVIRSSTSITDRITVTANYTFTTFFIGPATQMFSGWWGGPTIPDRIPVRASSTMPISTGAGANQYSAATATAAAAASQTAQAALLQTAIAQATQTAGPYATQTAQAQVATSTAVAAATQTAIASGAPTSTATGTATATSSPTASVTPSPTSTTSATPTKTSTPSPTPTAIPLVLNPIAHGDPAVTGSGAPGALVELRDYSVVGAPVIGTGTIGGDGTFSIGINPAAVSGHLIIGTASNGSADSQIVISGTPTATPTATRTATATGTATLTPTATPPTPVACTSNNIEVTVYDATRVKKNGILVQLVYNGAVIAEATTGGSGANSGRVNFVTDASGQPLLGNRTYLVQTRFQTPNGWNAGYVFCGDSLYLEIHLADGTPTPTATSSVPPAPNVTSAICSVQGSKSYHELAWTTASGAVSYNVFRSDDGGATYSFLLNTAATSAKLAVDTNSIYFYYVTALNAQYRESYRSNIVLAVCGATPTPTVTPTASPTTQPSASPTPTTTPLPDLIFATGLTSSPASGAIAAWQPVVIRTSVRNQGTQNVDTLFWVDLYVNDLPDVGKSGRTWAGVSGLAPGATAQVTMTYVFTTPGSYSLYGLVDSYNDVAEANEGNNTTGPLVLVVGAGTSPTATVTKTPGAGPTATGTAPGSISGWTWIFYDGEWTVPTGRVVISAYQGSTLVASTVADNNGFYRIPNVPAADNYVMFAETMVDNEHYTDTLPGVDVLPGTETTNVNLVLFPFGVQ